MYRIKNEIIKNMNALDITEPIPKEKRKLVNTEKLAIEYEVSREYVDMIMRGDRKPNTPIAKAIKEKAIKIIEVIESL